MGIKEKKVINLKMSATKKESFSTMIIRAIASIKDRKGASRTAIANWIQANCSKESGASFNAHLRKALKKGIDSGLLKEGATPQRFRIGQLPKPKKVAKKKVAAKKRKKVSQKKKTKSRKKKSVLKK